MRFGVYAFVVSSLSFSLNAYGLDPSQVEPGKFIPFNAKPLSEAAESVNAKTDTCTDCAEGEAQVNRTGHAARDTGKSVGSLSQNALDHNARLLFGMQMIQLTQQMRMLANQVERGNIPTKQIPQIQKELTTRLNEGVKSTKKETKEAPNTPSIALIELPVATEEKPVEPTARRRMESVEGPVSKSEDLGKEVLKEIPMEITFKKSDPYLPTANTQAKTQLGEQTSHGANLQPSLSMRIVKPYAPDLSTAPASIVTFQVNKPLESDEEETAKKLAAADKAEAAVSNDSAQAALNEETGGEQIGGDIQLPQTATVIPETEKASEKSLPFFFSPERSWVEDIVKLNPILALSKPVRISNPFAALTKSEPVAEISSFWLLAFLLTAFAGGAFLAISLRRRAEA